MKRIVTYLALAVVVLSLVVFGTGGAPRHVTAENSANSPIYTIYCDYDGPDAVLTPCGYVPASHVHFVGDGSVIKLAPEGNYVYSSEGRVTEFAPEETETPDWLHRVDITKSESAALSAG
jgi:hypothetical protein